MNFYQRLGTFLTRCYGVYLILSGVMGFSQALLTRFQALPSDQFSYHLGGGFNWVVAGTITVAISDRVGRVLGDRLERPGEKPPTPADDIPDV